MNGRMHPLVVVVVAIVSGAWGCAAPVRGAVAVSEPRALIYCDRSPGTIAHAVMIQGLMENAGGTWVYATDAAQMSARLAEDDWSDVYVLAEYSEAEPAYADALRDYANADPKRVIRHLIWKPHDTPPPIDRAVVASTAIVVWNNSHTATFYAHSTGIGEPETVVGLVFPDFDGVQTLKHSTGRTFTEDAEDGQTVAFILGQPGGIQNLCETCLTDYIGQAQLCNKNHRQVLDLIWDAYGPQSGSAGDPQKVNELTEFFNGTHTSCIADAVQRFEICQDLNCEEEGEEG